jgi:hypothetical protein
LKSLDWDKIAKRIKDKKIEDGTNMSKQGFTWPIKLEGRNEISINKWNSRSISRAHGMYVN